MSENTPNPFQPVLFFLSKIFILIGMVLVFTFISMGLAMFISKVIMGVDVFANPSILNEFETNPAVLRTLKLIQIFNTIGGFLLPALLFPRSLGQKAPLFLHTRLFPDWRAFLIAAGILFASMPLISALITWNEAYVFPASFAELEHKLRAAQDSAEHLTRAFIKTDSLSGFLTNLFIVALLPAICEEFFFRGALMRFLMLCMRNKHLVIALTALIFSVLHGEFFGILPRFALGLFLGYMTLYSGSLWPSILAHFLNNGLALLAEYMHFDQSGIEIFSESYVFPIYWVLISAGITVGLIWLMKKTHIKNFYDNGE
jgi:hypothetical protein